MLIRLEAFSSSQGSTYFQPDESNLIRCSVTMPSGARVFSNVKPVEDKGFQCRWERAFPTAFGDNPFAPAGNTAVPGVYLAEWDGLPREQTIAGTFTVVAGSMSARQRLWTIFQR